jgi:endonuclease/exonuclease/phosphatase family metal-dependent hydrolase
VRLRVGTYNVKSYRLGFEPVVQVISQAGLDLVLLQECGRRRRLLRLAERLHMEVVSSAKLFDRTRNAVLFRPPWRLAGFEVRRLSRAGRTIPRGFVAVKLRAPRRTLCAVSFHLGLSAGERQRHAGELTDFLAGVRGPLLVGGDINEGPDGPAARWLRERLFDVCAQESGGETFPAREPVARIDALFARDGAVPVRAWVPSGPLPARASDHLPVLAEVDLEEVVAP